MGGVVRGGEESISDDDWDGGASQLVVQYTIISKSRKVREQEVRVNGGKWKMGNGKWEEQKNRTIIPIAHTLAQTD